MKLTFRNGLIALLALCGISGQVCADVKMPGLFSDHMVLQEGVKLPVWGWADAGEEVTVAFGGQTVKTKAGADGKWRVDLKKTAANHQPQQLIITGKNTVTIEDVLVGEVWLCSGQSNMEFGVFNCKKPEEIKDPEIRVFCLTKTASLTPLDDTMQVPKELVWDTGTGFWSKDGRAGYWNGASAVGYLYGERIREITGNPVGLITSHWGGTPAQAWTSREALEKKPELAGYVEQVQSLKEEQKAKYPVIWAHYVAAMRKWSAEVWEPDQAALKVWEAAVKTARDAGQPEPEKPKESGVRPSPPANESTPSTLFNAMINPLIPYAIKGAIWYQGESNAGDDARYSVLFPTMIADWRARWGQGDFPFFFVQLAGFGANQNDPKGGRWAFLRESQSKTLALPATGMATAVDLGDIKDIHPRNKFDVAKRLSLLASNRVYGKKVVDAGPVYDAMKIEGDKIRVTFQNVGTGLVIGAPPVVPGATPNPVPAELTGFEIAGADQKWQPAKAVIAGNAVTVSCEAVTEPVAVRYAWADCPAVSLYSKDGLPAFPFRTDDWK